ncbi:MAG: phosphoribosylamine--glycine ligase [Anaerolineae bacterium]|nr:phosphoribosylamine--glycine ligase [Anaerolineae bacterium]
MRVLVVGSGGREHALAWKLAQSPSVSELLIAPGNPGTASLGENVQVQPNDVQGLVRLARERQVDLTVIGPEAPLAAGLADALTEAGLAAFGPSRAAAAIETSKVFAKEFMARHGIPTASFRAFSDYEQARAYVRSLPSPPVIKADGLAAGKGVIVCDSMDEAQQALRATMVEQEFGEAGRRVVVEERLCGQEVSLLAFTDGERVAAMLPAQDHKPIYDGDKGPNTGGMGAFAPAGILTSELQAEAVQRAIEPAVAGLQAEGRPYRGVLYAGLILTDDGLKVLEFNCRFGDPEAQALLPLLDADLAELCLQSARGHLDSTAVSWHAGACVCVVMASGGYPGPYETGYPIDGIEEAERRGCLVFHAGTRIRDGRLVTAGGRVLGVTATGPDLSAAITTAYEGVEAICFPGAYYRTDIGAKGLAYTPRPECD